MPQSLARLHVHLIFSTKHRQTTIRDAVREQLHPYLGGVLKGIECAPVLINSVEDHIHLLFDLGRTVTVSDAVEEIKTASSKWMKQQGPDYSSFAWQSGYGAFAVSESKVNAVRRYIARQREHHATQSFQQEYREFLVKHQIPFNEQYVWD